MKAILNSKTNEKGVSIGKFITRKIYFQTFVQVFIEKICYFMSVISCRSLIIIGHVEICWFVGSSVKLLQRINNEESFIYRIIMSDLAYLYFKYM